MPRPGPRPYECIRRAWHSESHQSLRGGLTQEIFRIVTEFHRLDTRSKKEWQEKLPIVVLRAEEILYSKARSEAEYADLSTLKARLDDAVNTMIRRTDESRDRESAADGPFMEPCVEAALSLGCAPKMNPRGQRSCQSRASSAPRRSSAPSTSPIPSSSSSSSSARSSSSSSSCSSSSAATSCVTAASSAAGIWAAESSAWPKSLAPPPPPPLEASSSRIRTPCFAINAATFPVIPGLEFQGSHFLGRSIHEPPPPPPPPPQLGVVAAAPLDPDFYFHRLHPQQQLVHHHQNFAPPPPPPRSKILHSLQVAPPPFLAPALPQSSLFLPGSLEPPPPPPFKARLEQPRVIHQCVPGIVQQRIPQDHDLELSLGPPKSGSSSQTRWSSSDSAADSAATLRKLF